MTRGQLWAVQDRVMTMIRRGRKPLQVAAKLGVSERTILRWIKDVKERQRPDRQLTHPFWL